ncbi:MAG: nucleoside triphosphate pyrophosphohydrolase [Gemmatimonadota bacterium]
MQDNSALARAIALVADLRMRCPWDRAQTRATLRPYLVEEAHELDHALASGDPATIREELGDLLLQLAYHLVIAKENGEFTADDLADDLERKMKRRHPHLFDLGLPEAWEALKRREKQRDGVLEGLPPTLPDLLLAYRLQERAASVGFDWPDAAGPLAKVREELAEVEEEVKAASASGSGHDAEPVSGHAPPPEVRDELIDEIGDLLFSVVNLSRKLGVLPTEALGRANRKFVTRFRALEALAAGRGIDVARAGLEVLDALWEEAKEADRS